MMEADVADVTFENGTVGVAGTDRRMHLPEVAVSSFHIASLPGVNEYSLLGAGTAAVVGSMERRYYAGGSRKRKAVRR